MPPPGLKKQNTMPSSKQIDKDLPEPTPPKASAEAPAALSHVGEDDDGGGGGAGDSDDNIKVAVRLRPFNKRELAMGCKLCVTIEGRGAKSVSLIPGGRSGGGDSAAAPIETQKSAAWGRAKSAVKKQESVKAVHDATAASAVLSGDGGIGGIKTFNFDHAYNSHDNTDEANYSNQEDVFNDVGKRTLRSALQGFNNTLFAYGQTGAGKSYSMIGIDNGKTDPGIVPRVCELLFGREIPKLDPSITAQVTVSMLEIYNEHIRDLLNVENNEFLQLRQHKTMGFYVEGLTQQKVSDASTVMRTMDFGANSRTLRATDMNATSSRAHTIFTLMLHQTTKSTSSDGTIRQIHKRSQINLVDLAGSERADKTGAKGEALKEGAGINLSLSVLGQVISALAKPTGPIPPYRQSKLTSILKESLGGNAKTCMVAALSPADDNYEETLSTLQFAQRCKQVKNSAKVNQEDSAGALTKMRDENAKLKKQLEAMAAGNMAGGFDLGVEFKKCEEELEGMFKEIDADGNGTISHEEFAEFLLHAEEKHDMERFQHIMSLIMMEDDPFESIDTDGTGEFTFDQFKEWVEQKSNEHSQDSVQAMLTKMMTARMQMLMHHEEMYLGEDSGLQRMTSRRPGTPSRDPPGGGGSFGGNAKMEAQRDEMMRQMAETITNLRSEVTMLRKRYGVSDDLHDEFEKVKDDAKLAFEALDTMGTGQVKVDAFVTFLTQNGQQFGTFSHMVEILTAEGSGDQSALFAAIDKDGNGSVSWEEFLEWIASHAGNQGAAQQTQQIGQLHTEVLGLKQKNMEMLDQAQQRLARIKDISKHIRDQIDTSMAEPASPITPAAV